LRIHTLSLRGAGPSGSVLTSRPILHGAIWSIASKPDHLSFGHLNENMGQASSTAKTNSRRA